MHQNTVGGFSRINHHSTIGIAHKRMPPEFDPAGAFTFMTMAIDRGNVNAVGQTVGPLGQLPCFHLRHPMFFLFRWMPSDCRGVDNDLGTFKGGKACSFRVPLVPAHQHTEPRVWGIKCFESEVARGEIVFFKKQRIVRNMVFAVEAYQVSLGPNDGSGVVVKPRCSLFKQRCHHGDTMHLCGVGYSGIGWAGYRFSQIEQIGMLPLAEIRGSEKFR